MKKIFIALIPLLLCTSCYHLWKHKHHSEDAPTVITQPVNPPVPEDKGW